MEIEGMIDVVLDTGEVLFRVGEMMSLSRCVNHLNDNSDRYSDRYSVLSKQFPKQEFSNKNKLLKLLQLIMIFNPHDHDILTREGGEGAVDTTF